MSNNGHLPHVVDPLADLTPRELETLSLMAEGLSNRGIAERMVITEHAVEKHVRNVLWKATGMFRDSPSAYHRRVFAVVTYLEHSAEHANRSEAA